MPRAELLESRVIIEAAGEKPPIRFFAYPRNRTDARCREAVRAAGYEARMPVMALVSSLVPGPGMSHASPAAFLAKVSPGGSTPSGARIRVTGSLQHP